MRDCEPAGRDGVLVVDDDEAIREMMATLVEVDLGLVVREAEDGAAAIALICQTLPKVVVTDVRMPNVDGVELVRRLRNFAATRSLPILIVAASIEARNEAMRAGADDYVDKPFDAELLLGKVRARLSRS
jgi:CheY-like chemotaxis protein